MTIGRGKSCSHTPCGPHDLAYLAPLFFKHCFSRSNLSEKVQALITSTMPRTAQSISELGGVEECPQHFVAHLQYRVEGIKKNIRGPRRQDKGRAEADLNAIRGAGELGKSPEEALEFMRAEAKRQQEQAQYEGEMQTSLLKRAPSMTDDASEDDPWGELDYEDFLDRLHAQPQGDDEDMSTPPSQKPYLTPMEATTMLMNRFRPIRSSVADLEHLLAMQADPNAPVLEGRVSPLRHVISFAKLRDLEAMRNLLLASGAEETDDDRQRLEERRRSEIFEAERVRLFKEDPREEDPCQASIEAAF